MQISVGTDNSSIKDSEIRVGDVAGRDISKLSSQEEIASLRQQIRELQQFIFGDPRLGLMGIHQQLQGLKFWVVVNAILSAVLIIYEFYRLSA